MNKIVKSMFGIFILILLLLSLYGCNNSSSGKVNDYPVIIEGVSIKEKPKKVVVLSDSLADIVLALKLETQLVARTDECTQEDLSVLPSIGSKKDFSYDKVAAYAPDLVLTDEKLDGSVMSKFSDSNVPVIVLGPAVDRDSFIKLYKDLGMILQGNEKGSNLGDKVANDILKSLDDINRIIPDNKVIPTACYFYNSLKQIATGDTFASDLIELAGAANIAKGSSNFEMDSKDIKISQPNYIFCAKGVKDGLISDDVISKLKAVTDGKIYEMDKYLMTRQGKTVIDAVIFMAEKMYPELAASASSKNENESLSNSSKEEKSSSNEVSSESAETVSEAPSNTVSKSQQVIIEPKEDNTQTELSANEEISEKKTNSVTMDIPEGMYIPYGEKSDNVKKLEERLDELDYMPTVPDGEFDDYTVRAIKDFQYINNLECTGEATEETLRLLFSGNAIQRKEASRSK